MDTATITTPNVLPASAVAKLPYGARDTAAAALPPADEHEAQLRGRLDAFYKHFDSEHDARDRTMATGDISHWLTYAQSDPYERAMMEAKRSGDRRRIDDLEFAHAHSIDQTGWINGALYLGHVPYTGMLYGTEYVDGVSQAGYAQIDRRLYRDGQPFTGQWEGFPWDNGSCVPHTSALSATHRFFELAPEGELQ